jgi:hypothetical protein
MTTASLYRSFEMKWAFSLFLCLFQFAVSAQKDTLIKRIPSDTGSRMNMDAVYNRPFLTTSKSPVAVGGYLEANAIYLSDNGVKDGLSFEMRRFTLFLSSSLARKIRFLSEIEFENGTQEINLEYAAVDFEFHPMFNLRGGVIMNPIGAFNQNHDGPRWEFVDRPISATQIIPATLSSTGFGLHGKYFSRQWILGYEAYITNGFDGTLINNDFGRTSLEASKDNTQRFSRNASGEPLFTGKVACRNRRIGELGFSIMRGVYNTWRMDGRIVDDKRYATALAVDANTSLLQGKLNIIGEAVRLRVDMPPNYLPNYGSVQLGCYLDVVYTVAQKPMLGWDKAKINAAVRLEYVDFNRGRFTEGDQQIGDELWSVMPGISFRPTGTTVLRLNYRYQMQNSLFNGIWTPLAGWLFGFSSYF